MACSCCVATIVSVLTGSLEGREQFLSSNLMQIFGAGLFQGLPLMVAFWHGPHLKWLIGLQSSRESQQAFRCSLRARNISH